MPVLSQSSLGTGIKTKNPACAGISVEIKNPLRLGREGFYYFFLADFLAAFLAPFLADAFFVAFLAAFLGAAFFAAFFAMVLVF